MSSADKNSIYMDLMYLEISISLKELIVFQFILLLKQFDQIIYNCNVTSAT